MKRLVRRRRSRRHRRNRIVRRLWIVLVLTCLTLASAVVTLRFLSPSLFRASRSVQPERQADQISHDDFVQVQQDALRDLENRPVYPYSIVPGGVKDASELKWAADHDPVVREHYRGFDFAHAHVVKLVLSQTVYLSYRIGKKVYWTRHRVTLKKGETVLTDGKITARTKCGNRVEEMPQQATSSSEPPAFKFDEPMPVQPGPAVSNPPVAFQSALLNRPSVPGLGPAPPLSLYDPIGNNLWTPMSPPPLPGLCGVGGKKKNTGTGTGTGTGKKKKGGNPCGNGGGGGEVPEPGTWVMMISGLAAMAWMMRGRLARA